MKNKNKVHETIKKFTTKFPKVGSKARGNSGGGKKGKVR